MSTEAKQRDVLSVKEVAERLGVSKSTAYEACRRNQIPCIRLSERRFVVPRAAFEKMLAEGQSPEAA
jgi:excisionase family DNA binding protein